MRALTPTAGGERGAVLVMVAVWLPVLAVMLTFVVDVGNWFVHKRHLQIQADAAALAGAQDWGSCAELNAAVAAYSGGLYNAQIGGTPPTRVSLRVNKKSFYDQPGVTDDTDERGPCDPDATMLDVKLTEVDLPWFVPSFFSALPAKVKYINAQARVSVNQVDSSVGALPVGVPDTNPKSAHATFINEATGAVLGSTDLIKTGTSNGLAVWDNAGAPLPVPLGTAASIGVVIALGGLSSTTCGQPLVTCYDAGASLLPSSLPSRGIVHARGWSAAGNGAQPSDPILRGVTLASGSCVDPYFSSATSSCTFGVRTRADFGPGDPLGVNIRAKLTATVGGTTVPLTYSAVSGLWSSPTTAFALAPAAGPVAVTMDWAENAGTLTSQGSPSNNNCGTTGGNKCKGTFGTVQRAFSATEPRSGPIKVATVTEGGLSGNSLERCSAVHTSCTHDLVVSIGVKGNLGNAQDEGDPVVAMRVAGGSRNQSLDCDPNPPASNLRAELAAGCRPTYRRNTGTTACPGSPGTLWAMPQPWTCVAVQTGGAVNQVPAGLNLRILGDEKPSVCPALGEPGHNNWSMFDEGLPQNDPRIIEVFLTPFGSFDGSGSTTVPVTDFATFYVTGWTGQGGGFGNPCQGTAGDDPVPGDDPGVIVGHFIKYIQNPGTGGGTAPCDLNAFGSCVAVMTR
jgi:hypothetical protein